MAVGIGRDGTCWDGMEWGRTTWSKFEYYGMVWDVMGLVRIG